MGVMLAASCMIAWGVSVGSAEEGQAGLRLEWKDRMLRIYSARIPTGQLEVWYLEAYCRRGSTHRDWSETIIPFGSKLVAVNPEATRLQIEDHLEPGVGVLHNVQAGEDEVHFEVTLRNLTDQPQDVEWAQPCIRVGAFTGLDQEAYIRRCFIFTEAGLTTLDRTRRTEEARYHGGQVYVPKGIDQADVNPRPISPNVPVHNLIGCFSADGQLLLAMTWDHVQELFQGVVTCIHADLHIGGLKPRETKTIRGKLYLLKNRPEELLARYRRDFRAADAHR